jgi:multicomponent Na+:H+ antiporter subunit B
MNRGVRHVFFFISALGLAALYVWALRAMPPFGHYRGPYGDVLNAVATYERHVQDVVTAVNFDYRGFDTLGEESILFISVVGAVVLLRRQKRENGGEQQAQKAQVEGDRPAPAPSDAVRALTLLLAGPMVAFGLYVVAHGQLSPGGGFQGGVILATVPLLVYLAGDFETFKRITSHTLVEMAEAAGLAGYLVIGFIGMAIGTTFLQNVFPLGETGEITSSGSIVLISLATGLEVAGGFVLLLYAFLEQTLEVRLGGSGEQQ